MKDGKRLTRSQKIALSKLGYDPKQYHLLFETDQVFLLKEKKSDVRVLVDKHAGK